MVLVFLFLVFARERWSTRFTDILSSGWYDGKIVVRNMGVGACNIDVWIDRVHEFKNADMVIVDLSVNDQVRAPNFVCNCTYII